MIGELLGRFHPLIVHLPIGILIGAFLMELASKRSKWDHLKKSVPFVLQLAVLFSILAWFTGWIMPKEGEFDERLIGLHFWTAVATTVGCLLTYLLAITKSKSYSKFYFPVFCVTMILLTVTGHFGGSLTHGEDYLTKPLVEKSESKVTDVNTMMAFGGIVEPILKQKCYSCHNEGKKKGGLVMSTAEALMKGGDEGVIIKPGSDSESPLIQRLHLPIEDDKHMPPSGKKQLSQNEISLLEWWIAEGASFDKSVGELNKSDKIAAILKGYEQSESQINTKGIKKIGKDQLAGFARNGIEVSPLHADSPLAFVSMARDSMLSSGKIKKLKSISDNIIELDLSFTNVDDEMMSQLSRLKNLQKLKIQQTDVSAKGIEYLEGLNHLSYLNLYGTKVNDEVFASLDKIKTLKEVFLWDTDVSKEALKSFIESHPLMKVSYGIDPSIFGDAKLKPPVIIVERDIFEDTIGVSLSLNFKNTNIYYTMDGSVPDSTSNLYAGRFVIDKTASIKAISMKDGWGVSDPSEKLLIKVGHTISSAKLKEQPNKKYRAGGAKSLIDYEKGSSSFAEGKWLGFEGKNMIADFDLGSMKSVSNLVVSCLEDTGSYIFFPKGIEVSTSKDGKNFETQKRLSIPISQGPNSSELKSFLLEFDTLEARYIRTTILGTLKNPEWHAAPGAKNWIFVDEVMIN